MGTLTGNFAWHPTEYYAYEAMMQAALAKRREISRRSFRRDGQLRAATTRTASAASASSPSSPSTRRPVPPSTPRDARDGSDFLSEKR
eukprot:3645151-Rhodomonas_salina.2